MKPKNAYKKLPGRHINPFLLRLTRLYQGSDHLLQVDITAWHQGYRRYYFEDIQALMIKKDSVYWIYRTLYGFLSLLFLLLLITAESGGSFLFGLILFSSSLAALFYFIRWGGSINCYVQTVLATYRLPSLRNERQLAQFLATVDEALRHHQKPAEDAPVPADPTHPVASQSESIKNPTSPLAVNTPLSSYRGRMHYLLFVLWIFESLLTTALLINNNVPNNIAHLIFGLTSWCVLFLSVIRQRNSLVSDSVKKVTLMGFAFKGLSIVIGVSIFYYVLFQYPEDAQNHWKLLIRTADLDYMKLSFYRYSLSILAGAGILLGLSGLLILATMPLPKSDPEHSPPPTHETPE